eukprot:1824476-Rhodomonas_salina.2
MFSAAAAGNPAERTFLDDGDDSSEPCSLMDAPTCRALPACAARPKGETGESSEQQRAGAPSQHQCEASC